MLSVTIHVHERPDELHRLLDSLGRNHSLKACRCLIVNNASLRRASEAVSRVVRSFAALELTELSQKKWENLQKTVPSKKCNERLRRWMSKMRLGRASWNVHSARNIGMIATALLYRDVSHVLNFDSDVVVPPGFELKAERLPSFSCCQISGCPDLSRLEWIELFCRTISKGPGLADKDADNYVGRLISQNDPSALKGLLKRFTDLFPDDRTPVAKRNFAKIPQREEYYGACYLLSVDRFWQSPVPSWFDNDWSFFSSIRTNEEIVEFLPVRVGHAASRKTILCPECLRHEEYGKLLHHASNSGDARPSCNNARRFRLMEVHRITLLAEEVSTGMERSNSESIDNVLKSLEGLRNYIDGLSIDGPEKALSDYAEDATDWRQLFPLMYKK